MARPVWTGTIVFGLVSVPVKLYTGVRERAVRFHQVEEATGARIRYRRVSEQSGEEVPREGIVRGYELDDGRYVTVSDEDLEAAAPEATRTIDIEDFVDLAGIDPVYYDTTYYVGPADRGASRPYALLHEAMRQSGRAAIGRLVLRSKQRLVALRPLDGILAVETMHFHDEVADPSSVEPPVATEVAERELEIAHQLIDALTTDWKPEAYADTYREQVLEIIERKASGEEIITPAEEPEPAEVIDLVSALRESVERSRQQRQDEGDGARARSSGGARARDSSNGDASNGHGTRGRPGKATQGADDLEAKTRQQLYHEAQEAGIRGRSEMTKDELVAALRSARERQSA